MNASALQTGVAKDLGAAIGVFLVVLIATVLKSYYNGFLRDVLDARRERRADGGRDLGAKLDDIQQRINETYTSAEENGEKIDDLGEAIVLLHRDDEDVQEQELRRKVGVDGLDDDFLKRGGRRDD